MATLKGYFTLNYPLPESREVSALSLPLLHADDSNLISLGRQKEQTNKKPEVDSAVMIYELNVSDYNYHTHRNIRSLCLFN
jgi:hypothetical protein